MKVFLYIFIILILTSCSMGSLDSKLSNDDSNQTNGLVEVEDKTFTSTSSNPSLSTPTESNDRLSENSEIPLSTIGLENLKELTNHRNEKIFCKIIAYENIIYEKSIKLEPWISTDISIFYPEFLYVIDTGNNMHNFDYDLIEYTNTLNYLIKKMACDVYTQDHGMYLTGIQSMTNYEIKQLTNTELSIIFKTSTTKVHSIMIKGRST